MVRLLDYSQTYLTEPILEVLDGFLLGDGNIEKPPSTVASRLTINQKQQELSEWIADQFSPYGIEIREKHQFDKRTNKTYVAWKGKSHSHPDFLKQYRRWYPDGTKHIPIDVRLTPISLMIWYLGDGHLGQDAGNHRLLFASQSFSAAEIDSIPMPKLDSICPHLFRRTKRDEIRSNCGDLTPFFDYIGWTAPVRCMDYKFRTREYFDELRTICNKNMIRGLESGRGKKKSYNEEQIQQLRQNGLTLNEIAQHVNLSISQVWRVCKCVDSSPPTSGGVFSPLIL